MCDDVMLTRNVVYSRNIMQDKNEEIFLDWSRDSDEQLFEVFTRTTKPAGEIEFIGRLKNNDATLTELDLSDNEIGDGGAQAISEILGKNRTLIKLDLWNNKISAVGVEAISAVLVKNTTYGD